MRILWGERLVKTGRFEYNIFILCGLSKPSARFCGADGRRGGTAFVEKRSFYGGRETNHCLYLSRLPAMEGGRVRATVCLPRRLLFMPFASKCCSRA